MESVVGEMGPLWMDLQSVRSLKRENEGIYYRIGQAANSEMLRKIFLFYSAAITMCNMHRSY